MKTQTSNNKGLNEHDDALTQRGTTAAKRVNVAGKGGKKKHSSALLAANKGQSATESVKPTHPREDSIPGQD